ncbi:hypothetical protein M0P65_00045 [Candidatus Gracilibacteria bacterium]|nr:hypothetical protein [Candidatus Gracilibacteria bacterium]
MKSLKEKEVKLIANNLSVRLGVVKKLFELFFIIYFQEYITHNLANYQFEMMRIAMEEKIKLLCILAFRGSAKTTILSQAFPIWSVLCNQKKFVLIISKSAGQAKLFLENIKLELENNEILKNDFGLNKFNVIIGKSQINIGDSVIKIANINTSLRGLKRGKYRPDLIICDDIEDLESIKTKDLREKLYMWFKKEVLPLGGENTKIILLGNYLSRDSLLNTIITEIKDSEISGECRKYPIIDFKGNILWYSKYKNDDLQKLRDSIGDNKTWYNEYLLTGTPNSINTIKKEDFVYFKDEVPLDIEGKKSSGVYIDFNKGPEKKDKSLIFKVTTFGVNQNAKYYIYNNFSYEKFKKNQVMEKYDELKQNLVTKRKRIYGYKNNIPSDLYGELINRDIEKGNLFKQNEYNLFKQKKILNYVEKFELLIELIGNERIIFQEGCDFIINEILEYGTDGTVSKFMKQFLDFIDYIIDSTFCQYDLLFNLPPSPFYFDPIKDQENYYDFEKEDFYRKKWKGRPIDEKYILESYREYEKRDKLLF